MVAFRQRWCATIEPAINQLATLVDLHMLVNPASHTLLGCCIYASEVDALAAGANGADQQLFEQSVIH